MRPSGVCLCAVLTTALAQSSRAAPESPAPSAAIEYGSVAVALKERDLDKVMALCANIVARTPQDHAASTLMKSVLAFRVSEASPYYDLLANLEMQRRAMGITAPKIAHPNGEGFVPELGKGPGFVAFPGEPLLSKAK